MRCVSSLTRGQVLTFGLVLWASVVGASLIPPALGHDPYQFEHRAGLWLFLAYVVAALLLHPRIHPWWRYALPIAWGISWPWLLHGFCWCVERVDAALVDAGALEEDIQFPFGRSITHIMIALDLTAWSTIPVLRITTRCWPATLGAAAAAFILALRWIGTPWMEPLAVLAWHPLTSFGLLWWAVDARLRPIRPPHFCRRCGYDLRGTSGELCPECGEKRAPEAQRATDEN